MYGVQFILMVLRFMGGGGEGWVCWSKICVLHGITVCHNILLNFALVLQLHSVCCRS